MAICEKISVDLTDPQLRALIELVEKRMDRAPSQTEESFLDALHHVLCERLDRLGLLNS